MKPEDELMYLPEKEKDGKEVFDVANTVFDSLDEINLDDIEDTMNIKLNIKKKESLLKKMPTKKQDDGFF